MKIFKALTYILVLFVIFCNKALTSSKVSAFEGTHFFVGFMQNEIAIDPRYGGLHLIVFIVTSTTTDITVIFPKDSIIQYNGIKPNQILKFEAPLSIENYESEVVQNKLIEIISSAPIVVYGFSTQYLTSDAYTAIPVEKWGTEYVVMSYPNDQYLQWDNLDPLDSIYKVTPRQSEFLIMSAYDNTTVTFYPKAITARGGQVGQPQKVVLNRGQCYLVKSYPFPKGYGDLTGTIVRGDKPFGVLSGHVRTAVPQNLVPRWDSKNHLVEMLMPTNAWGREFITVPFKANAFGDLIRITGIFPNTVVTMEYDNQRVDIPIDYSKNFVDIPYIATPVRWISNNPIQVAQFPMHSGTDGDSPNFDPAMVIVPPVEQFVNRTNFQTPQNMTWNPTQFLAHMVNIVGHISALDSLKINGIRLLDYTGNFTITRIFNDYFWTNVKLEVGQYLLESKTGMFSGIVYGFGLADGYAFVLGSSLLNPFIQDSSLPLIAFNDDCGNLDGFIYDSLENNGSGLGYVFVIRDSTYNYNYSISNIIDTSGVYFTARLTDRYKKAKIVIEARDKNGNTKRLSYSYEPPDLSIPNSLKFDNVKLNDSLTKSVKLIYKSGSLNIRILKIRLKNNDPRFSIFINKRFPIELDLKDSVVFYVSIAPKGSLAGLSDTIIIETDCNLVFEIPIIVTPLYIDFEVYGYDFKKVYLGDTAVGFVKILNKSGVDVYIDSIMFQSFGNVFFKEAKPRQLLKAKDSLVFRITFVPKERRVYSTKVVFFDEIRSRPEAVIIGEGVAPDVASLFVDFGNVRIGRSKDTIVYLSNNGNINTLLSFTNFISVSDNFDTLQFIWNKVIPEFDSIAINLSFTPTSLGYSEVEAEYISDWKLSKPIIIKCVGQGVLPKIKTNNVIFDTIFIDQSQRITAKIIESIGTETLRIDKAEKIEGDFDSFVFDSSWFNSIDLPVNAFIETDVVFAPKKLGVNYLKILVYSDAVEGYGVRLDTILFYGYALSRDTIDGDVELQYFGSSYLCQKNLLQFTIKNSGNVDLKIVKIELFANESILEFNPNKLTGQTIPPNSSIKDTAFIRALKQGLVVVFVKVIFENGFIVLDSLTINFEKIVPLIKVKTPEARLDIGKWHTFTVEGKIENEIIGEIQLKFVVTFDSSQILIDTLHNYSLKFTEYGYEKSLPMKFSKLSNSQILLETVPFFIMEYPFNFSFEVPFLALLNENVDGVIYVYLNESDCFSETISQNGYKFNLVCIHPMRNIEIITLPKLLNYYPNPATENLTLDIFSEKNDFVIMKIFDKFGRQVFNERKNLKAGINTVNIDLINFANSIYNLVLENYQWKYTIIFIKVN